VTVASNFATNFYSLHAAVVDFQHMESAISNADEQMQALSASISVSRY